MDAAFILREKEIGLGRLPAIVHPKPIFRCDANLLFDDLIYFCSERGNGGVCLGRIKALGEYQASDRRSHCAHNRRTSASIARTIPMFQDDSKQALREHRREILDPSPRYYPP